MNRYPRVVEYLCGCRLQSDDYSTRETCRQHGVPVEPQPVGRHAYDPAHPVHCECNHVPEAAYGILENRDASH